MINVPALKLKGTQTFGRAILLGRKHSPEILTATGIAGFVGTVVLASQATLKQKPLTEQLRDDIALLKEHKGSELLPEGNYTKALTQVYTKHSIETLKNYGPAITLGLASIACVLGAHGIMKKRNVAVAAAYKTLEDSFNKYRERVVEELGAEQENDILKGIKEEETVGEDGKKVVHKISDPNAISGYARFFDEYSKYWEKTPEYNLLFIRAQQNYANDKLKAQGHLFLNEVYDMLDIPRTKAGSVVGWVIGGENSDNFVDFGLYSQDSPQARAFINGIERSVRLDFNVDGTIFDKI